MGLIYLKYVLCKFILYIVSGVYVVLVYVMVRPVLVCCVWLLMYWFWVLFAI